MHINLALINTWWVVYTQWKGNLHNPASACTHWLGHRNTRTHAYWEITKSHHGCMRFPPTISILENHITKAYNCRQHFSCMIANNLHNDSDPKTMAMAECKPLARIETIEGRNPSRISLAPPNESLCDSICSLPLTEWDNKVVRKQGL